MTNRGWRSAEKYPLHRRVVVCVYRLFRDKKKIYSSSHVPWPYSKAGGRMFVGTSRISNYVVRNVYVLRKYVQFQNAGFVRQ